ncbi:MAG TPA: trans-sulfuration enzyme family protein [Cyclobacteriaceae bacterium]
MEGFNKKSVRSQTIRTSQREHSTPLFLTSSFVFDSAEHAVDLFNDDVSGNIYSRYSNPNNDEFIKKLCLLENTEDGFATATGMAAMFLSMASFLEAGDHLLACRSLFGSTHQIITKLFPRWGIEHTYLDIDKQERWHEEVQANTKLIFIETPSNPSLDIVDLSLVNDIARANDLIYIVDNCFATPYLQRPTDFGADIITHSATKFIDGQGRVLGGAILGSNALIEKVRFMGRHTGPAMSPFNGWVLSKSLETLAVRMDRHCKSAEEIADRLYKHPEINWVKYPFHPSHPNHGLAKRQMTKGGGVVSFEVKGGLPRAHKLLNAIQWLTLSSNLGDSRTIITHPTSTTHSKLTDQERNLVGITDGMLRLSIGLEEEGLIYEDLDQALDKTK